MNIDQALDILRKCCENIDIDINGHERECGHCENCLAVASVEDAIDNLRENLARFYSEDLAK